MTSLPQGFLQHQPGEDVAVVAVVAVVVVVVAAVAFGIMTEFILKKP